MPLNKSLRSLNTVFTKLEEGTKTWDFTDFPRYRTKFKEIINEVKNFLNYLPDNLRINVSIRTELENRISRL